MRQPKHRKFWEEERDFFLEQAEKEPPQRMGSFRAYGRMQSNFCWKDGFHDLAEEIAKLAGTEISQELHEKWLRAL